LRAFAIAAALAPGLLLGCAKGHPPPADGGRARIVSLSPAMTETLFAIGAGADVVGRTEYDDYPPEVRQLPAAGTSLRPSYEAIVRLAPTLIVGQAIKDAPLAELERIAPTRLLPWLTLADICAGMRELGRLTGHIDAARALARRYEEELSVPAPTDGPRVLLVIEGTPGRLDEVYYLRQNSVHGACLNAAGARNAMPAPIVGAPPVIGIEKLIAVDPDAVIVLAARPLGPEERDEILKDWRALPMLAAVQHDRVRVVDGHDFYVDGPRMLRLVPILRDTLRSMP
jgi:iron complex transport system substrate-binding protein